MNEPKKTTLAQTQLGWSVDVKTEISQNPWGAQQPYAHLLEQSPRGSAPAHVRPVFDPTQTNRSTRRTAGSVASSCARRYSGSSRASIRSVTRAATALNCGAYRRSAADEKGA